MCYTMIWWANFIVCFTCATHSVTHLSHMCGTCVTRVKHLLSHEIQMCGTPMLHMCSFGKDSLPLPPSTLELSFEIEVSYCMFYSIVIYFSQLSYFVSNRSDERLREHLERDKREYLGY